jgi:PGF-pre-PGF domain-containing protein
MSLKTTNLRWSVGAFTLVVLGVMTLLFSRGVPSVHAEPKLGHIFYGTVVVGGTNPGADIEIQARITVNGTPTNYAFSNFDSGVARTDANGKYGLNTFRVLADDTSTANKEGGTNGERVEFFVGGDNATLVAATVVFTSGKIQELNLSVSSLPSSGGGGGPIGGGGGGGGGGGAQPTATPAGGGGGGGGGGDDLDPIATPDPGATDEENEAAQQDQADAIEGADTDTVIDLITDTGEDNLENLTDILEKVSDEKLTEIFEQLDAEDVGKLLDTLDSEKAAEVIENLTGEKATEVLEATDDTAAAEVLAKTDPTKAADILENVSTEKASGIVEQSSAEDAAGILELVQSDKAADILEDVTAEKGAGIMEEVSTSKGAGIMEQLSIFKGANIMEEVSTSKGADIMEEVSTSKGADIIEELSTSKGAGIMEQVSTSKGADIIGQVETSKGATIMEEVSTSKGADIIEEVPTAKAAAIIQEVTAEKGGDIVVEVATAKAADILEAVATEQAAAIMDRVVDQDVSKMNDLVQEMTLESLLDKLPDMTPESFFEIDEDVLFEKFVNVPTEQLIAEEPPPLDPRFGAPRSTQITEDLVLYEVPETGALTWVKLVGSPVPIDAILAKFATAQSDLKIEVESLTGVPAGAPLLPSGQELNSIFSVDIGGTNADAEVTAHLTVYVDKLWLEANDVHKWAVQFQRLDESSNSWVPFQTKRLREDEERVFYSVSVPGFSVVAVTGSDEIPTRQFDVTSLSISPPLPKAGEEVTVSAVITNIGTTAQTITATLYVDGVTNEVGSVELAVGATDVIVYTTQLTAGVRELRVDRQIQSINVEGAAPTPTPQPQVATPTPQPTAAPTATPRPAATATSAPATPTATQEPATPTVTATDVPATPEPTATILPAEPTSTPTPEAEEEGGSPLIIILAVVVALAVVGGGVAGYFILVKRKEDEPPSGPGPAAQGGPTSTA